MSAVSFNRLITYKRSILIADIAWLNPYRITFYDACEIIRSRKFPWQNAIDILHVLLEEDLTHVWWGNKKLLWFPRNETFQFQYFSFHVFPTKTSKNFSFDTRHYLLSILNACFLIFIPTENLIPTSSMVLESANVNKWLSILNSQSWKSMIEVKSRW